MSSAACSRRPPRSDGRATLVVFAADNGLALGSHGLMGKQSVYEHSLRVPLILAGPGVPAGRTSNALVYLNDLYPTLLAAAGATADVAGVLGQSLWPLVHGECAALRESLFLAIADTQRAVTDGRFKLIRYPRIDFTRLFDLASDPHELFDLAALPEHSTRIEALTACLRAWQREVGDELSLSVADPDPAEIDLSGHERAPDRWQPRWIREKYFDAQGR
jgi:arylsulfatase A-like enzyme